MSPSAEISKRSAAAGSGAPPAGSGMSRPSLSARMMKNSSGSVAVAGSRSAGSLRWLTRRICADAFAAESCFAQPETRRTNAASATSLRLQPDILEVDLIHRRGLPASHGGIEQVDVRVEINRDDRRGLEDERF